MAALIIASVVAFVAALGYVALRRRAYARTPPTRPVAARATKFAQRDVVVDGVRIRYVDEGSGPPLLLVPGHTSRVEEYDRVVGALCGRFRVLSLDFPGTGYSDKPDRTYDLAYYDRVLVGFLDAMGVGECFLAGGSLGGNLVLRAARAHPARFPRVVAWAPGSAWPAKPFMAWCMRRFGLALFHLVVRIQSTYWYSRGWKGRDAALRAVFAYYDEVMCPGFVRMYWGIAADQVGSSLVPTAHEIRQPVLLMWGDRDHGFDMGTGVRRLHARMPKSELIVFRGAGHALAAERSDALIAHLAEFLSRPAGPR